MQPPVYLDIIKMNTEAVTGGVSVKKGVFRNFTKFTGKYLCQSRFLIKLQAKKETLAQVFSSEFGEN